MTAYPDDLGGLLSVTLGSATLTGDSLGPVSIRRGRDRPGEPYGPDTCSLSYIAPAAAVPALGADLTVILNSATQTFLGNTGARASTVTRFAGTVTDLDVRLAPDPAQVVVSVIAVSRAALLSRRESLGSLPAQRDSARASALVNASGLLTGSPYLFKTRSGGYIDVAAVTYPATTSAADALAELAEQTGGALLWRRTGDPTWVDIADRARHSYPLVLSGSELLAPAGARLSAQGVVNSVTVDYGTPTAGTVTATDSASVNAHGIRRLSLRAPHLTTAAAATDLAQRTLTAQATPAWEYDTLTVDLLRSVLAETVTGSYADHPEPYSSSRALYGSPPTGTLSRLGALLDLDVGDGLLLADLPATVPLSGRVWLEGCTETVTRDSWRLALTVTPHRGA